jgi:hypothetical protein
VARFCDGDGWASALPRWIGVDQGHDRAGLQQSQPARYVVGPVFHEQRHRPSPRCTPALRASAQRTIRAGIQCCICRAQIEIVESNGVRRGVRLGLDDVDDRMAAVRRNPRKPIRVRAIADK